MRIKEVQLPAESVQTLIAARKQARMVERARKRLQIEQEKRPLVKSPRLDGMPRAPRNTSGLEGRYIQLEPFHQRIEQEESRLQQARDEARRIICYLPDKLQDFCFWYYIEGMSMEDTAAWLDRDISTCWRYKKVIEKEIS